MFTPDLNPYYGNAQNYMSPELPDFNAQISKGLLSGLFHPGDAFQYAKGQGDYNFPLYLKMLQMTSPQTINGMKFDPLDLGIGSNGHLTDLGKLPNHESFSHEAWASGSPSAQPVAGDWQQTGSGENDWSFRATPAGLMSGQNPFFKYLERL
jgi:hypothetical protein